MNYKSTAFLILLLATFTSATATGSFAAASTQSNSAQPPSSELQIISVEKVIESSPSDFDRKACEEWNLTESEIIEAFAKMRRAEPVEWGAVCYVLPCRYSGRAKYQGQEYNMEVNAASFISLYGDKKGDKAIYFIQEQASPYFLMPCDCCETE